VCFWAHTEDLCGLVASKLGLMDCSLCTKQEKYDIVHKRKVDPCLVAQDEHRIALVETLQKIPSMFERQSKNQSLLGGSSKKQWGEILLNGLF
jgi:hypothetical protein